MSEVLYRKYRPQEFKDVLGQEHIIDALSGALKQGNISHAYLFSGSRGTGKTSIARILAKEIKCSPNDLHEIDAASNRGIDDIRALREAVTVLPFESPYKVYIIDEVHMLTKEAFNALLKTLEEPPKHVIFVLATTEIVKLPETIISRCETHTFKKPSQKILKNAVLAIAKAEGFTLESAAADLIALLGDGSFRDAQGILQKILSSSSDKKISVSEVEKIAGAPKGTLVNDIVSAIGEGKLEKGLKAVNTAVEENIDMKMFLKMILHKVRSVMLLKYAKDMEAVLREQFGKEDFDFLKKLSKEEKGKINSNTLNEFLIAYDETGRSYIPQLPLELAIIKILKQDK
ncbi:MAG: DNA polymerase III subunit gamma/tau [Candidatus Pacebacteria bacterium]|jgi:DNA polymerase-3 subunit gamma/tau|nr:DNA polymerase III subunit gamma/tau [Candidatus Paceibacterota bacterium]|tara:strand:+ start:36498 stop:37532 length:1035 start_codon:yes stop_codon:yes gene_type:complete